MRVLPFVGAALIAAGLTGCVTPAADPNTDPDASSASMESGLPFTWSFHGTACEEAMILLLLPKDELQRHLPEGFVAGDATQLVSAQVPGDAANRGILFANAFSCEGTDVAADTGVEAQVGILVRPPAVEGERPAALFDFYELARVTPSADQRHRFDGLAWPLFPGNVTSSIEGNAGSGSVEQEGAPAWSMELTMPASQPISGIGRFWHLPEGGVGYVDYVVESTQLIGVVQCEITDGSVLAGFTSVRSCTPENAVGSALATFDVGFELHWLPGATVGGDSADAQNART